MALILLTKLQQIFLTKTTFRNSASSSAILLATCLVACGPRLSDVDAGRQIYREGALPDGEPLTAIVAGDVSVLGTQFNCENCHGRSGMGGAEAQYVVPPIAGPFLFAPSPQPVRPAYDADSLARLLRDGVTPGGRTLNALMPRYQIRDDDVAVLADYLATLSAVNAPGVDIEVIRFATVTTDDVDADERTAVLAVLNQYAEEKNRQTRAEGERWDRGYTPESRLPTVFREWVIDEWKLTGPAQGWPAQLDHYYQQQPVFAMLSGLSNKSWAPVGRFCEQKEIPCLLPGAVLTEVAEDDFYTLYFSRGLALEADLVASHLKENPVSGVIQISCDTGAHGVDALQPSLDEQGIPSRSLEVSCDDPRALEKIAPTITSNPDYAVVLWTQAGMQDSGVSAGRVYLSSTLMGGNFIAPVSSEQVFALHPFRLPGELDPALRRFSVWAKTRELSITHERQQAEAFFACLALNDVVMHMGRFFIRDYVLDMLEHAQGLAPYLAFYPRPTFGPDQRFISKGGYVVPVVSGRLENSAAEWYSP